MQLDCQAAGFLDCQVVTLAGAQPESQGNLTPFFMSKSLRQRSSASCFPAKLAHWYAFVRLPGSGSFPSGSSTIIAKLWLAGGHFPNSFAVLHTSWTWTSRVLLGSHHQTVDHGEWPNRWGSCTAGWSTSQVGGLHHHLLREVWPRRCRNKLLWGRRSGWPQPEARQVKHLSAGVPRDRSTLPVLRADSADPLDQRWALSFPTASRPNHLDSAKIDTSTHFLSRSLGQQWSCFNLDLRNPAPITTKSKEWDRRSAYFGGSFRFTLPISVKQICSSTQLTIQSAVAASQRTLWSAELEPRTVHSVMNEFP